MLHISRSAASPTEDCKLRASLTVRCILFLNRDCFGLFGSWPGHFKSVVLPLNRLGGDSAQRPDAFFPKFDHFS
jgi:hypothetical protein